MNQWLNSAGLLLNMLGVGLLFVFGPPQPSFEEQEPWTMSSNPEHQAQVRALKKRFQRGSRVALGFILVGFILQLAAAWIQ